MAKKLKTMDIKRKNKQGNEIKVGEYVTVNQRVKAFHELYPLGSIETQMIRVEDGVAIMKAVVWPDTSIPDRFFTGYAQEKENNGWINKTDCLENCETSAVGRALGFLGIGIDQSIATADDIKQSVDAYNAIKMPQSTKPVSETPPETATTEPVEPVKNEPPKTEEVPVETEKVEPEPKSSFITNDQIFKIQQIMSKNGFVYSDVVEVIKKLGYSKVKDIYDQDYDTIIKELSQTKAEWQKKRDEAEVIWEE